MHEFSERLQIQRKGCNDLSYPEMQSNKSHSRHCLWCQRLIAMVTQAHCLYPNEKQAVETMPCMQAPVNIAKGEESF